MRTTLISPDAIEKIDDSTFYVEKIFCAQETFLADHVLYGAPIVPGAIMLELMAECGHALLPTHDYIVIEDFRIFRKIRVNTHKLTRVYIRKTEDGVNIKMCGDFINQKGRVVRKDVVYAEASYKTAALPTPIRKDNFKKEGLDCFRIDIEAIYCDGVLTLGPFFQNLKQEICFSKSHFNGLIKKENAPAFLIEPALVDAGFQMGDLKNRIYNEHTVLPVGIDCFCFFNPLSTPTAHCYGVLQRQKNDVSLHDFIIIDEQENVIMIASGVRQQYVIKSPAALLEHLQEAHERITG